MKTTLLTLFTALTFTAFGQNNPHTAWVEYIDFDNPVWDSSYLLLEIDTTNSSNIWQIGLPQKTIFNQAYSFTNVLVTDTINPYPINNTSSFTIRYFTHNCPEIFGSYYSDADSLNDYGMIEFSKDNGISWIDVLQDSLVYGDKPVLTGKTNGWRQFYFGFGHYFQNSYDDTLLLRFTFISDSIDTQQEGLMFDDLGFCLSANTQNLYQLNNLKVFPNPTNNLLNFQFDEPIDDAEIRIYSNIGQLMDNQNIQNTAIQFNVSTWAKGIYYYGIFVEGKVVKQGQVLVSE